MDNLQRLIREADTLRRRLRASSQTWGSKVEGLYSHLLSSSEEVESGEKAGGSADAAAGFAHGFALMFLLAGVHGLEPIKGEPATEWITKWKEANPGSWHAQIGKLNRDSKIPHSFGSNLAGPLWTVALKTMAGRRAQAEDLLATVYDLFMNGEGEKIQPVDINTARGLVVRVLTTRGRNMGRDTKKERSTTPGEGNDEEKAFELVDDADSLEDMVGKARREHEFKKVHDLIFGDASLKSALEHIHPDALQYLEYIKDKDPSDKGIDVPFLGVNSKREVIGDPIMKHPLTKGGDRMYPGSWDYIKKKIFNAIQEHLDKVHKQHHVREHFAYNYDRSGAVAV